MGWRDKLSKGSWRGAPFYWESSEVRLGRRTARHDYPQRDESDFEDLGKIPREFTLEMFVLGQDYMTGRDQLRDAFEVAGPGALVHPTFGTLQVTVEGTVTLRETSREGGMARFTATFVRVGQGKTTGVTVDTAEDVRRRAAALQEKEILQNFQRSFSVAKQPAFVRESALKRLQAVAAELRSVAAKIPTNLATPGVMNIIADSEAAMSSLVKAPGTLAQSVVFAVNSVLNLVDDPLARIGLTMDLFDLDFGWGRVSTATPSRRQEAANQAAVIELYKSAALSVAATTVADCDFDSYQDAVAVRDRVLDGVDSLLETTADDDLYLGLSDLRAAIVVDVAARGADLARIVSYTPAQTLPALLMAHLLYGDATKEGELVARNKPRHPGFLPGGVALEVLNA